MTKVLIKEKFELSQGYWNPHILGEFNGQFGKAAKLKGKFIWQTHSNFSRLIVLNNVNG